MERGTPELGPGDCPGRVGRWAASETWAQRRQETTILTWPALEKELEQIRATRVAYDREENSMGISAVAMAIRSPSGELAAIAVPVPAQRFASNEAVVTRALREACESLERELGG